MRAKNNMSNTLLSTKIPTAEARSTDVSDLAREDGPFSTDPLLIVQSCLLVLALLTVAYVASEIILPLILAYVLKLLLQPAMRFLEGLRLPRSLCALMIIFALFGIIVSGCAGLSGPAAGWAQKLPSGIPRLEERLHFLTGPIQTLQTFLHQIDGGL
jgi:predicted PurR-regulated permease PerM